MLATPAYTYPEQLPALLRQRGYAVLSARGVCELAGCDDDALASLRPSWDTLTSDAYLKDGGRYRRRRHSCFVVRDAGVEAAAHRAHWQPVEYNALHGGMQRWFDPMLPQTLEQDAWNGLLAALGRVATQMRSTGAAPWYVEAHQFRIDTAGGIGRPTPEGAHRDGVDLVAVFLVAREGIKGGETRVFEAAGTSGERFTLTQPWSVLLLDDARVIHETTPILPASPGADGHRDTLVLTYRAGGFQGDPAGGAG